MNVVVMVKIVLAGINVFIIYFKKSVTKSIEFDFDNFGERRFVTACVFQ